jgi:hypothetical protein
MADGGGCAMAEQKSLPVWLVIPVARIAWAVKRLSNMLVLLG